MSKKGNKITKISPFNPIEVVYTNKILKGLLMSPESVSNGNGMFTSIKVHSDNGFDKKSVNYVCNKFREKFGKVLLFEEIDNCGLPTAYFNIAASYR